MLSWRCCCEFVENAGRRELKRRKERRKKFVDKGESRKVERSRAGCRFVEREKEARKE